MNRDITLEDIETRYRRARAGAFDWQMLAELLMAWARAANVEIDSLRGTPPGRIESTQTEAANGATQ